MALISAAVMIGGCAMGPASGEKTNEGAAALEAGQYQEAESLFQQAIDEGEQKMLAYRGLGIAFMGQAEYDSAEEAFKKALDKADDKMPENVTDIQLYLATVQYRKGEYEDTITTCDSVLEKEENPEACFLRGASYLRDGQQNEAAGDFDRAVAGDPDNYDLYLNIYECYNDMNLSGLGSDYLQDALHISGDAEENYYNRGRIYYYLKNYKEAQSQLIGPVENKYEPAMYLIGRVYLAQEDYEHAQAIYQQIQDEFGESAQSCNGLALCALEKGDYTAALSYISRGLELGDADGQQDLYFNEIVAYERMQDFASAKAKAQEYIERYPADEGGKREWEFLSTR